MVPPAHKESRREGLQRIVKMVSVNGPFLDPADFRRLSVKPITNIVLIVAMPLQIKFSVKQILLAFV